MDMTTSQIEQARATKPAPTLALREEIRASAKRWNAFAAGLVAASAQHDPSNPVVEKFFTIIGKAADTAPLTIDIINNAMDEASK